MKEGDDQSRGGSIDGEKGEKGKEKARVGRVEEEDGGAMAHGMRSRG